MNSQEASKPKRKKKSAGDVISKLLFFFSICFVIFGYGIAVGKYEMFPYQLIRQARLAFKDLDANPFYYREVNHKQKEMVRHEQGAYEGVNLVAALLADKQISAKVLDMDGNLLHEWVLDWFKLWPNATHVPESDLPKSPPGTQIHGCQLMENGDLLFNFSELGLVRIDPAGEIVWRLPYQTHHSLYEDDEGNFWVGGQILHEEPLENVPNY